MKSFGYTLRLGIAGLLAAVLAAVGLAGISVLNPVAAGMGNGPGQSGTSTLSLVLLGSTDGLRHWGQQVTFNVSTSATTEPNVSLNCYQNATLVYGAVAGFYPSYPWPGSQTFTLSSPSWTGGAASCTAKLYYFSGKKTITLTMLSFQVYP